MVQRAEGLWCSGNAGRVKRRPGASSLAVRSVSGFEITSEIFALLGMTTRIVDMRRFQFVSVILCGLALLAAPLLSARPAAAQFFLQVEAHPTLQRGQEAAAGFAAALSGVSGHRVPGGWYAVTVGPYPDRETAQAELRSLRSVRAIPSDSFVVEAARLGQRFFPVGAAPTVVTQAPAAPAPAPVIAETPAEPEETPSQARASERLLTGAEKRALQEALQWEGYYTAAIDGAFGPGTRRSMERWQEAKGYRVTGVLTTRQRAELLDDYNSVFEALGLETVIDPEAGIEILLPMAQIARSDVEPPFVRYMEKGGSGVEALLISQQGDQATLFGLYDIMQSLEIVPAEGERTRRSNAFTLTGQDARRASYTYATLSGGAVKGFTLVWPRSEDRVMSRIVERVRASFAPIDGAILPDVAGSGQVQSVDLIAGLAIRRPLKSRSALWVDGAGRAVTTTDLLDASCGRYTLAEEFEAEVVAQDAELGLALLAPRDALAPPGVAGLRGTPARIRSEIAVAGFPFEGRLGLPSITFGQVEDVRGLQDEATLNRLSVVTRDGDAGGPVFDMGGAVAGLLQAQADGSRALPQDVRFAVTAQALDAFLKSAGVEMPVANSGVSMAPEDMTRRAADTVVLASCWE